MKKNTNIASNKNVFDDEVVVLSGGKGNVIFHYMSIYFEDHIKALKNREVKFKEINHIISGFGADKRESINSSLILEIKRHLNDNSLKVIHPIESKKEDGKLAYKVSGSKLIKKPLETGLYGFSPRSELNAIVIVRRQDEKGKILDKSVDILEYQDGQLITMIPGGIGETKIDNLGEMAKNIGIVISAGPQLTKPEIKAREKAAAFHINEAFQDSKKKKEDEDLLESVKSGAEEAIDKGDMAVKTGKIIDLSECPERIKIFHQKKRNPNRKSKKH